MQEPRQRPNIFLYYITVSRNKLKSWYVEESISRVKTNWGRRKIIDLKPEIQKSRVEGDGREGCGIRNITNEQQRGKSLSL